MRMHLVYSMPERVYVGQLLDCMCRVNVSPGKADHLSSQTLNDNLQDVIDSAIDHALARASAASLPVGPLDLPVHDVLKYHLGRVNDRFEPDQAAAGKRIRPKLCLLACQALGGELHQALPVAAAIELIHNFTLIHDDIQDRSELRRHRRTVQAIWGESQAINAGDAMFAVAHLTLNQVVEHGLPAERAIAISNALHHTTLRIVEGQTLDLGFEERLLVSRKEYLRMIGGKSAAIIRFACEAGARVSGAPQSTIGAFADFGEALGIGFQIHDDMLGVWGAAVDTGKPQADDIRRRKKALPLLLLLERATDDERDALSQILDDPPLTGAEVAQVLEMMRHHEIQSIVVDEVNHWHDLARERLDALPLNGPAAGELQQMVEQLAKRIY